MELVTGIRGADKKTKKRCDLISSEPKPWIEEGTGSLFVGHSSR